MNLVIEQIGGNCPVQAEGTLNGLPFYFRARGECWALHVAAAPDRDALDDDAWVHRESYRPPDGREAKFAAGWMSEGEARAFIASAAARFVTEHPESRP